MMIGQSEAFHAIQALIDKMAAFDAPVLIEGETGTGKELAARAIHYGGARRGGPFVPINCGAVPDSLIENELFGHRRGAFTDARDDQAGLAALANGGTLFLDEIDALTRKGQVTLLRFIQDHQFRPLGGRSEQQADVRIIAASHRSLDQQTETGEFRLDLLYRLKLMHLELPPLRVRRGDIPLLAVHFIKVGSARFGKPERGLDTATLDWFERYAWPGNIRELENLVLRAFLLSEGTQICIPSPSTGLTGGRRHGSRRGRLELQERQKPGDRRVRGPLPGAPARADQWQRIRCRTDKRNRTPASRPLAQKVQYPQAPFAAVETLSR